MTTIADKFWRKVTKTDTCWLWTGGLTEDGYGLWYGYPGTRRAHRIAYELGKGPVPKGLDVHQTCTNRICVNPDHLVALTRRECLLLGQTVAARNALRTHCPRGHKYPKASNPGERRWCDECRRLRQRKGSNA